MNKLIIIFHFLLCVMTCCKPIARIIEILENREGKVKMNKKEKEQIQADETNSKMELNFHEKNLRENLDRNKLNLKVSLLSRITGGNIKIKNVYALDARIDIPEWSAVSSGIDALGDDNLLTSWMCEFSVEKPCALGFTFTEPSSVEMIRIFTYCQGKSDICANKTVFLPVRIHFESGWVNAKLKSLQNFQYLLFNSPIVSKYIVIEFSKVLPPKENLKIYISEFDLFGAGGKRKNPIEMDVENAVVRFEGKWQKLTKDDEVSNELKFKAPLAWVESISADGLGRRLFRGNEIYSGKGGCYYIVENVTEAVCERDGFRYVQGDYTFVDKESRMFWTVNFPRGLRPVVFEHPVLNEFLITSLKPDETGYIIHARLWDSENRMSIKVYSELTIVQIFDKFRELGFNYNGKPCCSVDSRIAEGKGCKKIDSKDAIDTIRKIQGQEWREILHFVKVNKEAKWNLCFLDRGLRVINSIFNECEQVPNLAAVVDESGNLRDWIFGSFIHSNILDNGSILIEVMKRDSSIPDIYTVDRNGMFQKSYLMSGFGLKYPQACNCNYEDRLFSPLLPD